MSDPSVMIDPPISTDFSRTRPSRKEQSRRDHKSKKRRRHWSSSSSSSTSRSDSLNSSRRKKNSKRSKHLHKKRRRRSMTPSSSSNTYQSQIDIGRYKRANKSSQVVQTPIPVQPHETNFIPVNTQPINIDEFQPNLPQTNKVSDSETETEIWSFDRAIHEVFRLLPAELCPKTQQDQAPAKPLSGIEHLMESRSTPLLVLPQSELVENTTEYIQNRLDLDKCFRDWIYPQNLVSALAPTKFYKSQNQYLPTDNIPQLEADASLLDISNKGRASIPLKNLEAWERKARKLVSINSHADLFSSAAFLCLQQESMSVVALSRLLEAVAKSIKHATAISILLTTEIFQARRDAALSRLLEAVAKSIKHATAISVLLTTEIFQARRDAALASSKLLLDNSSFELRNAPINSKTLFDGRIKEIAKSNFEAQQQRFFASTSIQSQSSSVKPPTQSRAFKIPKYPAKQTMSRPKPTQSYRSKFNIVADRLSRLDKPVKTEWALDQTVANSVFQMLNFPNVDLFATRFNHKLPLYVSPVQDNKALAIDALSMDWNHLHAYAFPPFILIPAVLEKIRQHQCRIVLIALFWPQQQWFSELLSVSSDSSATNSKICSSKPPTSRPSRLGVIKQSIRDKKFSQDVAGFVSRSRRTSTQKVYDAKWSIFSNWCHTKKVNPISAPITAIADFLIFLFLEKKCQISTIKGYRAMISNTLKFKTGNRIGSNPVLSELIRSFELQRPVQRSLTPKWDLSWHTYKNHLLNLLIRLLNFTLLLRQPFF